MAPAQEGTLGIFVGGKSRRMGGSPKGLLLAPDGLQTLLARTVQLASALGLRAVLVGDAQPYDRLLPTLARVADAPPGIGPLGGLRGLLQTVQAGPVLAVACDMPYLSEVLLGRLLREQPATSVLAARGSSGLWEPLCARYRSEHVLPLLDVAIDAGVRSFQALFRTLQVGELALSASELAQLRDWDAPADLDQ